MEYCMDCCREQGTVISLGMDSANESTRYIVMLSRTVQAHTQNDKIRSSNLATSRICQILR